MKLNLAVLTPGKLQGKTIPVTSALFAIGRDPSCTLRVSSQTVSKRHCTLAVHDDRVYVRDCGSRNGTVLNGRPVEGEIELQDQDRLKVGPLDFVIQIERATLPVTDAAEDDAAAAALLAMEQDESPSMRGVGTLVDGASSQAETNHEMRTPTPAAATPASAKPKDADTSAAAQRLLEMYRRRNH